jgi:L-lactate dehydrogenase
MAQPQRTQTYSKLLKEISPVVSVGHSKVTVVGAGQVGMACTFSLLTMGICSDLALVDLRKELVMGEKMDLIHGQAIIGRRCNIEADSDYAVSKGSKVIVITAGARQGPDETRLDLVQKNVGIFKGIVPELVQHSPDAIFVIVSNPCDIMAWVTWKLSGLPKHRVMSTGTILDTSRFRHLIAERFGFASHSVHGFIVGEHGDSSVAVWSTVNIAGTRLRELCPTAGESADIDPENWIQCHTDVIHAAYEIIKLKGYTNWAIGMMVAKLCETIIKNQRSVLTIGWLPEGWNGITDELFLAIPCVIGERGVSHIVSMKMSEAELNKIRESATALKEVMNGIQL